MCLDAASDKAVEDHGRAARSFIGEQPDLLCTNSTHRSIVFYYRKYSDSRYNGFLRSIRLSSSDRAPQASHGPVMADASRSPFAQGY